MAPDVTGGCLEAAFVPAYVPGDPEGLHMRLTLGAVAIATLLGDISGAVADRPVPAGPIVVTQDAWRTLPPLPGDRPRRGGQARDPLAPPPISIPDPLADRDRALKRMFEDPGRRLGLPAQPNLNVPSEAALPPPELNLPPELQRLDRNRDGAVSRDEYMRGHNRMVPAGPAGEARQRQIQERLDSRFREADRDRSGSVTPLELQDLDHYGTPRNDPTGVLRNDPHGAPRNDPFGVPRR